MFYKHLLLYYQLRETGQTNWLIHLWLLHEGVIGTLLQGVIVAPFPGQNLLVITSLAKRGYVFVVLVCLSVCLFVDSIT